MNIQFSNWQAVNLLNLQTAVSNSAIEFYSLFNSFNTIGALPDPNEDPNTHQTGYWNGYRFDLQGNHLADATPIEVFNSLYLTPATVDHPQTLYVGGNVTYDLNAGTVSGYYNQLTYFSPITQTNFRLIGKINLDAFGNFSTASYTELTLSSGGYTFSYLGNFTQDATGAINAGTFTSLTVLDNLGQKITVSGATLNAITIDNLLDTTLHSDLTGLYSYIMSPTALAGNDSITGDTLNNTIDAYAGNDTLIGGAGSDTLNGGLGSDTADYGTSTVGMVVELWRGTASNDGTGSADVLTGIESLTAGSAADMLVGDYFANQLDGGNGNDMLYGLNDNDTLLGGAGNDLLNGGVGADVINGGADFDTVDYSSATNGIVAELWRGKVTEEFGAIDTVFNVESFLSGSSHDFLVGDFYANRIEGGAGNDVIYSLNGDDTLIGGIGADWLYGGADTDTIDYSASTANVVSVLWLNSTLNDGSSAVDTLDSIENLIGGQSYDFLVGSFYANRIEGGAGNDVIYSINGDDTLMGGQGADWLYGGDNTDTADYSSSTASVVSELWRNSTSNDGFGTVDTLDSIENLIGGSANDTLVGDFYANRIDAGAGDDKLYGLSGADTLNGGLGIDTADYSASTATVVADLRSTTSNDGFGSADTLISIENLIGGSAADYLVGDVVANKLEGNAGNDYLYGLDGNDTLIGGLGNDSLNGGLGNDVIVFNETGLSNYDTINDFVSGQDKIYLFGATFSPALSAGIYFDVFITGTTAIDTNDYLIYNQATGNLFFDADGSLAGAQQLIAHLTPNTTLLQSDFVNALMATQPLSIPPPPPLAVVGQLVTGTAIADNLTGGADNDVINGLDGNDTLNGGQGGDTLIGGLGSDMLTGGLGADHFDYSVVLESNNTATTSADIITDFSSLDFDKIDLSAIDANSNTAINDPFTFVSAYTGTVGEIAYDALTFSITADTNGDGQVDFFIGMWGVSTMSASDFIL
jgi:Ca2+-binding RTX toxin-like protein